MSALISQSKPNEFKLKVDGVTLGTYDNLKVAQDQQALLLEM
jgi:hypothetical protein